MKVLILLLANLGITLAASCLSGQYEGPYTCVECSLSPCSECKGTPSCDACPTDFESTGSCDKCTSPSKMPVNKKCVSCTDLGATDGDGKYCSLPSGTSATASSYCPKSKGVYVDTSDSNKCKPCSGKVLGCTECSFSSGMVDCENCPSGTTQIELTLEKTTLCLEDTYVSFGSGLFPFIGLLIAILTLI